MKKVLVIGDVMLDMYVETEPVRISDEAPVLITKVVGREYILGGAANTAANLKALGLGVMLQGVIGNDYQGEKITELLDAKKIESALMIDGKQTTTIKGRILCKGKQVIRVDEDLIAKPIAVLKKEKINAIVVSDYAKGVVGENTIRDLKENYKCPIIVNGKPKNVEYYTGATVLVLNQKETKETLELTGLKEPTDLVGMFALQCLVVTKGKEGIALYTLEGKVGEAKSKEVCVRDITGAGDTVTATLTYGLIMGLPIQSAMELANIAGGIKVTKDKTAVVTLEEMNVNPEDEGRETADILIARLNSDRIDG